MDKRRENRFQPSQLGTVTVMGLRPGPVIQVSILDVSGSGLRLRSRLPVPCGADIEIETNETIARGHVCRCEPDEDAYELGIQITETAPVPVRPAC